MPKPSDKSGRAQLNVWVKSYTQDYIKEFAEKRGYKVGQAVDKIIELHNYYMSTMTNEEPHPLKRPDGTK